MQNSVTPYIVEFTFDGAWDGFAKAIVDGDGGNCPVRHSHGVNISGAGGMVALGKLYVLDAVTSRPNQMNAKLSENIALAAQTAAEVAKDDAEAVKLYVQDAKTAAETLAFVSEIFALFSEVLAA